ncbi:putative LPS assembly protein LptD [Pontibacter sp. SGAir0037]|uniref:putative LPS assembly protein LptD n=1 Tax=Pontibacter sp. SGAir0037 TaxID=2571030 RepID=UPI0010F55D2A|nr:putative LPS assembly protein LptD [Pontibacter sp. SGAir0037]
MFLLLLQFCILSSLSVSGQTRPRNAQSTPDTVRTTPQDTLSTALQDTVEIAPPPGDIATTIKYSARDSILFEVDRKVVHLYGNATVDYGTMSLKAAYIGINYDSTTLTAATLADTTGRQTGQPVFADGGQNYEAKRIVYNYKTRKGLISQVVTQQGEGYIHGEVVKRNENNEFSVFHAKYTTCNLEHPHFYINATKIKAIPNEKVMSGPFNLVFADIPLPVGFLFGLFPTPKDKRSSGIIVPTYGETRARGFSLSNGGFYLALNDYIGTSVTGSIYSLGGYQVSVNNAYFKRYSYQGNFNFSYDYFKNDEADVEGSRLSDYALPPSTRSFMLTWSHSPVVKPGRGRFTANVNFSSPLYTRLNVVSTSQYLSANISSSISYQKTIPNSPFSYGVTLRHSQTNGASNMNLVLPDMNFAMTQMSLYEIFTKNTPTGKWYENFTFGYSVNFNNSISNQIQSIPGTISAIPVNGSNITQVGVAGGPTQVDTVDFNFNNLGRLWNAGRRQANHNFSIGLGNYKVFRFFNLNPSVSYSETWVDRRYTYTSSPNYISSQPGVVAIDTAGFGRIYQYSAGASLSTNVYGTVQIRGKRVEAIRHVMRPSISYSYSPDYSNPSFNYYQTLQVSRDQITGEALYARLPRYANAPGGGLQSAMNFNITNQVEMKVKAKSDTAAAKFEKVSLIDNLSIGGAYNLAADSFKLSVINVSMNTKLFKMFNLNATSVFDPYQTVTTTLENGDTQTRTVDRYTWQGAGFKLPRMTRANLAVQASFNPAAQGSTTAPPQNLPALEPEMGNMPAYIDFKIPWTLSSDFTFWYQKSNTSTEFTITKTLGIQGSLNMTDKWKISGSGTYNFTDNNIAYANVSIHRDLHCWDMNISWIPFGYARGYNLTINARSSILQDLKLTRNRQGISYR